MKTHKSFSASWMRRLCEWLLQAALVFTVAALAQAAQFPALECETLTGKHLTIPAAAEGDPSLYIVGFTQASSEQTSYWTKHIPTDLVPAYPAAVVESAPRLVRRVIVRSIKSGVPKALYDRFLIVTSNEKELKEAAQFQAPNDAYLMLVSRDGAIQWRFHGAFTHTALKDLREHLRALRP